jgi:hypothetical protein
MFLDNPNGHLTGIALKRSYFRTTQEFLEAIIYADQYHPFIFLDYEGQDWLVTPEQLSVILGQMRNQLVFTVSTRSAEFHKDRTFLLENYLRISEMYPNLTFCIVAGSTDYSSVDTQIPVVEAFHNILARVRAKTTEKIFLGAENLSSYFIRKLVKHYGSLIPFLLYGDPRAVLSNHLPLPYAIYTPMAHLLSDDDAVKLLVRYLLRRKSILQILKQEKMNPCTLPYSWEKLPHAAQRILRSRFQHYVLSSWNFKTRLETFTHYGAKLIVGYPCVPHLLFELIRALHHSSFPLSKSEKNFKAPLARLSPR